MVKSFMKCPKCNQEISVLWDYEEEWYFCYSCKIHIDKE